MLFVLTYYLSLGVFLKHFLGPYTMMVRTANFWKIFGKWMNEWMTDKVIIVFFLLLKENNGIWNCSLHIQSEMYSFSQMLTRATNPTNLRSVNHDALCINDSQNSFREVSWQRKKLKLFTNKHLYKNTW